MRARNRLFCGAVVASLFLPWVGSSSEKWTWLSIACLTKGNFSGSLINIIFFATLVLALAGIVSRKVVPVVAVMAVSLSLLSPLYFACDRKADIVQGIVLEKKELGRISSFFSVVKPDVLNPLDTNFLSKNVEKANDAIYHQTPFVRAAYQVLKSLSYGWYMLLISGLVLLISVIEKIMSWKWVWFGGILCMLALTCIGSITGDIYLRLARDSVRAADMDKAMTYLTKAREHDKPLVSFGSYNELLGRVSFWKRGQDSPSYQFLLMEEAADNGHLSEVVAYFSSVSKNGFNAKVINEMFPDVLGSFVKKAAKERAWSKCQRLCALLPYYPFGQDGHVYSGVTLMKIGGQLSANYALRENLISTAQFCQRFVLADLFVNLGCSYDRLDAIKDARENFRRSLKEFSLAKVINFRAQKALLGL